METKSYNLSPFILLMITVRLFYGDEKYYFSFNKRNLSVLLFTFVEIKKLVQAFYWCIFYTAFSSVGSMRYGQTIGSMTACLNVI